VFGVGLDRREESGGAADLRELRVEMSLCLVGVHVDVDGGIVGLLEADWGAGEGDGWRDGWEVVHFWESVSRL